MANCCVRERERDWDVRCEVCWESYSDDDGDDHIPVVGQCGHSICLSCSRRLERQRIGGFLVSLERVKCPTCRADLSFPLSRNYALLSLLNQMRMRERENGKKETQIVSSSSFPSSSSSSCLEGDETSVIITTEKCISDIPPIVEDLPLSSHSSCSQPPSTPKSGSQFNFYLSPPSLDSILSGITDGGVSLRKRRWR